MGKPYGNVQVFEGKWYPVAWGKPPFLEECCDCGLVHQVRYQIRRGRLEVSYKVDKRRTRKARALRKLK